MDYNSNRKIKGNNGNTALFFLIIAVIVALAIVLIMSMMKGDDNNGNNSSSNTTVPVDTSAQRAQEAKRKSDIGALKDQIMLNISNYQQEYMAKYGFNENTTSSATSTKYSNALKYIEEQLNALGSVQIGNVSGFIEVKSGKIKVYSDLSKSELLISGTISQNGALTWDE